ncbi:hypothetical protein F5146DRAFT_1001145 [Armillaria mellea]|nr:hypothetical protein F5146DRAFT_1001145 [Armillaria mellea]
MDSYILYIATSRGVADQTDRQQAEVFQDTRKVMDSIVDRVWKRFLRKIAMLKTHFLASGGFETLDNLVRAWLCWRATREKDGERKILEVILDEDYAAQAYQSHELQVQYFMRITSLSRALFKSSFFRDRCRRDFLKQMLPTSFDGLFGISVIRNTVGSSQRMCEVCILYAKIFEEISSAGVSFVFTPRCVPAAKSIVDNDWMLGAPSEDISFQNVVNEVVDRVISKFSSEADRLSQSGTLALSWKFFTRLLAATFFSRNVNEDPQKGWDCTKYMNGSKWPSSSEYHTNLPDAPSMKYAQELTDTSLWLEITLLDTTDIRHLFSAVPSALH